MNNDIEFLIGCFTFLYAHVLPSAIRATMHLLIQRVKGFTLRNKISEVRRK